jgi:septum formation protein
MKQRLEVGNPLVLASGSPRRRELLALAGIPFVVDVPSVDEENYAGLDPTAFARQLSLDKALTIAPRHPNRIVLGADTVVVKDGVIYGKPQDATDAERILWELTGHWHTVITAITLIFPGLPPNTQHETTEVRMRKMDGDYIRRYVASGEPMDKAGAYAIQDKGSLIVESIKGDFYNVVGLPLVLLYCTLKLYDVDL